MSAGSRELEYRVAWLVAGWIMVAAVVWLSLSPSPPRGPDFPDSDKLMHGLTYLVLMGWFGQLYPDPPGRVAVMLGFVAMGAGLELLQGLTGNREASWADGLANAAGVGCGWLLMRTRLGGGWAWAERWVANIQSRLKVAPTGSGVARRKR